MLDRPPAKVVLRQVHDRAAKVCPRSLPFAQELETSDHPQERLLDQVFGQDLVAREEIGESHPLGGVTNVEFAEL